MARGSRFRRYFFFSAGLSEAALLFSVLVEPVLFESPDLLSDEDASADPLLPLPFDELLA